MLEAAPLPRGAARLGRRHRLHGLAGGARSSWLTASPRISRASPRHLQRAACAWRTRRHFCPTPACRVPTAPISSFHAHAHSVAESGRRLSELAAASPGGGPQLLEVVVLANLQGTHSVVYSPSAQVHQRPFAGLAALHAEHFSPPAAFDLFLDIVGPARLRLESPPAASPSDRTVR